MILVSTKGTSVAEFVASHLYLASLSVWFTTTEISEVTDLSFSLVTEVIYTKKPLMIVVWQKIFSIFTFLSFLYQVKVASGCPPVEMQASFWTLPYAT